VVPFPSLHRSDPNDGQVKNEVILTQFSKKAMQKTKMEDAKSNHIEIKFDFKIISSSSSSSIFLGRISSEKFQ